MNPIFDHNELFEYLRWMPHEKEEEWYLIILANPHSRGVAIKEIYDNFIYLDRRTEDVHFFMPGYCNMQDKIETEYLNNRKPIITIDSKELNFDQRAFLNTIEWLETYDYRYSDFDELLFIRHKKTKIDDNLKDKDGGFDLRNIISFNLDELANRTNLTAFFRDCNDVVREEMTIFDLQQMYSSRITSSASLMEARTIQRSIKVFIAGSKRLQSLRQIARSALMGITNKSQKGYIIKALTFEDFAVSITDTGRQADYLDFIRNEADYAIFLLDSKVGGITFEEFEVALSSFKSHKRPKIFVYNKLHSSFYRLFITESDDLKRIKSSIDEYNQYYTDYATEKELELLISHSFSIYL